ncbi:MAG: UDP-N-acetylmuramate--L-alanine ligase [Candidatus Omnitrophica bacterium]|nr:UDP-N-acetylmuramate--L-alanine ligase [Candidatus Omnitrophota bacterium]
MSAVARMLLEQGYEVTGSDPRRSDLTASLERAGARVYDRHAASLVEGAACVIYSSSIRPDHVERLAAEKLGIPLRHRSWALASLTRDHWAACVCGTHGKTTTTAMLGRIFCAAGDDPTVVVGARVAELGGNVLIGSGGRMILEADESDASLLAYDPDAVLLTNVDADHLDHFEDVDEIQATFRQFLQRLKPRGFWIGCGECPRVMQLLREFGDCGQSYGRGKGWDYRIEDLGTLSGGGSEFVLSGPRGDLGRIRLKVFGEHNVLNAAGAAALALKCGLRFEHVQKGLGGFGGAERRFQILKRTDGYTVIDDYAHHPTEIRATLQAARSYGTGRIIAVFQPHRYTRTKKLCAEFAGCFELADEVMITDVYGAGETPMEGVDGQWVAKLVSACHPAVSYVPKLQLMAILKKVLPTGGVFLFMGAGDIGQIARELSG